MEQFLHSLQTLDPLLIYGIIFLFAFIENLFPPSPSDMVLVFGGSLAGLGVVSWVQVLLWSTAGSTAGFIVMYAVGRWFGLRILEGHRITFLPLDAVHTAERWFQRYGYWIIAANRFMPGTRAVVSFFAGMSGLDRLRTASLCAVSAFAWNILLVTGGYALGRNWQQLGYYLRTYSEVVTVVLILVVLIFGGRYLLQRRRKNMQ